jgi:uncharacterized protein YqeY
MVNSHHTLANQRKIEARDQSGAARELTLKEQIDLLTEEITKKQNSVEYYKSKGLNDLVETIRAFIVRKVAEREVLKAKYYASLMSGISDAMELAKAEAVK